MRYSFIFAVAAWAAYDPAKDDAWVASKKNWWAFKAPLQAEVPRIADPWVKTPIDAFVLDAMRKKGLTPAARLSNEALLRRAHLDLTGLPPAPGETDLFLNDHSPNAYEHLVDRLMKSPHYGERWALKWLDVVRYADTNGYELDLERPHAWRYRDYVVKAFNTDKPYNRFVREQIGGDEMFPGDRDALIATGFHRAGPIHLVGGNQDQEMNRQEVLTEMTGAIGSVFLGLTVGCARCHNHKFDPIPQADYYRMQAVLAATEGKDIVLASEEEKKSREAAVKAYKARLKPIQDAIAEIEKPYRERLKAERKAKLEPRFLAALEVPKDKRDDEQKRLAKEAESQISLSWDTVVGALTTEDREKRAGLRREMHKIEYEEPEPVETAYAVANLRTAPATHILKVGNHKMKLDAVEPGLLRVVNDSKVTVEPKGRRTALAEWLSSKENPLAARVMVNRIWQMRMGEALVATPNDFGLLGTRPTNQTLLDWLAVEFMEGGWSVKKIDRMIVMSSAYQMAGKHRRRLEAELLRDSVLVVSGAFHPKMGGKPVKIPIEREVYDLIFTEGEPDNLWPVALDKQEHYRRSLYLLNKRTVRLPFMANFDQPDNMTSCPVRPSSTHALQALSLMNSQMMQEQAEIFAKRLERECGQAGRDCQVRRAYKLALARRPRAAEATMAREFFVRGGPLADFCLALLNRNEFAYVP